MSNEQVKNNLIKAEEALNSINELGETSFDICDGILDNCKIHINDQVIWDKVHKKERVVTEEYQKRKTEFAKKLKDQDPFYAWGDGMHYYLELRKWKSMEMLSFWNTLSKQNVF